MKRIAAFLILMAVMFNTLTAFADGENIPASAGLNTVKIPYSYVLMEGKTGTLLYADNGNAPFIPFHSAKLMTLLLLCEAIERGELSLDTIVTVSKHANEQTGSQIWLDVGEKISIEELVISITVGNANDACAAIAEAVAQTEESFVSLMNARAKELGMSSTSYSDSTGVGTGSITTACDTAILASALSKYDYLKKYFTTWMTKVRGEKAELVSQNRLIRSYDWVTGMKAYYHKECGNCLIASGEKGGLTMICVIFGEPDEFERFSTAKEKMTVGFSAYSLYTPKTSDIILEPVEVKGGVESSVDSVLGDVGSLIVRSSYLEKIEPKIEYDTEITAPISAGDKIGRVVYCVNDEQIYAVDIVAATDVKKMNFFYAAAKLLKAVFSG